MQNISFCLYISLKIDPLSCFLNFAGFYICLQSVGEKAREIKKVAIYLHLGDGSKASQQKAPSQKHSSTRSYASKQKSPDQNASRSKSAQSNASRTKSIRNKMHPVISIPCIHGRQIFSRGAAISGGKGVKFVDPIF
jgi:hypothetical protein